MDMRRTWAAAIAVTLALVLFWLPGTFRPDLIVAMGVPMTNQLALIAHIVGGLLMAGGVYLGGRVAYRAISDYRKRIAELAPKPQIELISLKETDLNLIIPALQEVAVQYPVTREGIRKCLEQVNRIREVRAILTKFFDTNTGIVRDFHEKYGYGAHERLLDELLNTLCPGLVRIVYRAQLNDPSDVIAEVTRQHAKKVDSAQDLAEGVADSLANLDVDNDGIVQRLDQAIYNQENPKQDPERGVFSL